MCSISGFSFSKSSSFDARRLAAALLLAGQTRGTDATGYAYLTPSNDIDGMADHVAAKHFVTSTDFQLPQNARTAILHTRYATQGSKYNALNNHPLYAWENDSTVALVHNGMIWNDDQLFAEHQLPRYGEVDSAILPALLSARGSAEYASVLGEVQGSVAIGWLDTRTPGVLHVARAEDSPVLIARVDEPRRVSRRGHKRPRLLGVVYASTQQMLSKALFTLGLDLSSPYVTLYTVSEGTYFSVTSGTWSGKVTKFALPDRASRYSRYDDYSDWPTGWSQRSARTPTYFGGSVPRSGRYPDYREYESDPWADSPTVLGPRSRLPYSGYTEGYDAQHGSSYVSHPDGTVSPVSREYFDDEEDSIEALINDRCLLMDDQEINEPKFEITDRTGYKRNLSLGDIIDLREAGDISEAEASIYFHLEFCDDWYCVLGDDDCCPVLDKEEPTALHVVRQNSQLADPSKSAEYMTDHEIGMVAHKMLERAGLTTQ